MMVTAYCHALQVSDSRQAGGGLGGDERDKGLTGLDDRNDPFPPFL